MTTQAGKLKIFGTRPNWAVSYIAYTKFHLPRPVFHSPGQIFTHIGGRALVSQPATDESRTDDITTTKQNTTDDITTTKQNTTDDITTTKQNTTDDITTTKQNTTDDITTTKQNTTDDITTTKQNTTDDITTTKQNTTQQCTYFMFCTTLILLTVIKYVFLCSRVNVTLKLCYRGLPFCWDHTENELLPSTAVRFFEYPAGWWLTCWSSTMVSDVIWTSETGIKLSPWLMLFDENSWNFSDLNDILIFCLCEIYCICTLQPWPRG